MENTGKIYELIGKAIGMIGAIEKDKTSKDRAGVEQFKYRGIDQVYNALNPVMAELGIFFTPEVLDQKREEKTTRSGGLLTYTILTIRFTAYAPDGSNVQMTVVGEAMDSGDKSTNKAMSVAMKYAMFQLFCIPTEELKDPDADVYTDILPKTQPKRPPENGSVATAATIPQIPPTDPMPGETPGAFLSRQIADMKTRYAAEGFDFMGVRAELIKGGIIPDIPSATMTMEQARQLTGAIRKFYEDKRAAS